MSLILRAAACYTPYGGVRIKYYREKTPIYLFENLSRVRVIKYVLATAVQWRITRWTATVVAETAAEEILRVNLLWKFSTENSPLSPPQHPSPTLRERYTHTSVSIYKSLGVCAGNQ